MDVTIFSLPRTGTHFIMYFLRVVLGVNARFDHYTSSSEPRIEHFLTNEPDDHPVIITEGNLSALAVLVAPEIYDEVVARKNKYMSQFQSRSGYLPFNVEKHAGSDAEINAILAAIGQARTPQVDALVAQWPHISQSTPGARLDALRAAVNDSHRMRITYP